MKTYGLPLSYYVDNLRVFRFVQKRDSVWRKQVLLTDDIDPQWRQVMRLMGVDVTYALSPQAKGKIERPYRWLQDRIVRTCALENITALEDVRSVLRDEVDRYNNQQVHSTTGEIPSLRFEHARKSGNSLFRPFSLPKPYNSIKDIFCLRQIRTLNGYGLISLFNHKIDVPDVPDREDVELHLIPDLPRQALEVRIWFEQKMVHSLSLPLSNLRVHL
jgi:vacuolar-type H+-ATPase subunit F/Vma7